MSTVSVNQSGSTNAAAGAAPGRPGGDTADPPVGVPATLEPDRNLLRYYMLSALLFGPAMLFAAVPLYFRYRTLRYVIDEEGITMRWGILFRREISLTYARIQDIQLTSNVVERWLGLARIQLQTASGSSTAEMTIEGAKNVEAIRDFLYTRMRGVADPRHRSGRDARLPGVEPAPGREAAATLVDTAGSTVAGSGAAVVGTMAGAPTSHLRDVAELTAALDAVAAELRALREHLRTRGAGREDGPDA